MSLLKKLQIGDNVSGRYTQEYLLTDYSCHTLRQFDEFRPKSEKYCDYKCRSWHQGIKICTSINGSSIRLLFQEGFWFSCLPNLIC